VKMLGPAGSATGRSEFWGSVSTTAILLPAGLALNFVMNIVLARVLGPAEYGKFSFVLNAGAIGMFFATLGFHSSLMRFIPEYEARHPELCKGVLLWSAGAIVAVSAALFLIAVAGITLFQYSGGVYWICAICFILAIDAWRAAALRGFHHIGAALLPRDIALPAVLIALGVTGSYDNSVSVLIWYVVILSLVNVAGIGYLVRHLPSSVSAACGKLQWRTWLNISLPIGISALVRNAFTRLDILMLGILGTMEATGQYAAAARLALVGSIVLRIINYAITPILARAYHDGDEVGLRDTFRKALVLGTAVGLPFFVLIAGFPELWLELFGPDYKSAARVLQVLALAQAVNLVTGPAANLLLMTGHEKWVTQLSVAGFVLAFIGNLVLLEVMGIVGVALSMSFATVVYNVAALKKAWCVVFRSAPT
jgi:O-antigen/teichoic acid export membrane protein